MKLHEAIAICVSSAVGSAAEFDADTVVDSVLRDFSDVVREYGERLTAAAIRRMVTNDLKARGGFDASEKYEQLNIAGFESVPVAVPFYDGDRVRYIAAIHATEAHLLSAIRLREDNIKFCAARLAEYNLMLDLVRRAGPGATFAKAIAQLSAKA